MANEDLIIEKRDGIATITLNRPDKLNSVTIEMAERMVRELEQMNKDDETKVIVLTGTGRAFCSGADISGPLITSDTLRIARLEPFPWITPLFYKIYECDKPTIAALNGIVTGTGFGLGLACDIRIASENATFSLIFVKRGLLSGCGTTFLLPRIVGVSKAFELMWTGDRFDAKEAERLGLVNRVVPQGELMNAAMELAGKIAKGPSVAIELMKRSVRKGLASNDFAAHLVYEGWAQSRCSETEDGKEGIKAFMEKREPVFKGK
jgi:2-(1,2-epoxy-1,2-dihydrophenyl)acetyl-CoA isomerase